MMKLVDNKGLGRVIDVLQPALTEGSRFSILSNKFSLFAFRALRRELYRVDELRLVVPQHADSEDGVVMLDGLLGELADRRERNKLSIASLARECADWLSRRGSVRCRG